MAGSALRATIRAQRSTGMRGEHADNHATARYTLFHEIGFEGDKAPNPYDFDQGTCDMLIAHARQDAAHALGNTKSLLDLNGRISRQLRLANVLLLVSVCFLAAIVNKLYPQVLSGLYLQ
jgi:hypothetical protein